MKNNINELKFISNEDELYELADLINTLDENNTVTLRAVKEIISAGLTNKVLNVVPCEVGVFYSTFGEKQHKQKDNIPMFIKENYTIINVPSFSVGIAYAIPKCNYRFNLYEKGELYPSLPQQNSKNNVAIILTPMWSGYQVYEYVYEPVTQNNEAPGLIPFRYYIDDYREKEKTYWFSYEKKNDGTWHAHILGLPDVNNRKNQHRSVQNRFFSKETGYHYLYWTKPIYKLSEIVLLSKMWADIDYKYHFE